MECTKINKNIICLYISINVLSNSALCCNLRAAVRQREQAYKAGSDSKLATDSLVN